MFKCNFFLNNNILIIGASGQLGKYFVDKLSLNNTVIASDISNSNEFNCEFIYLDVLDIDNLKSVILKYKIEIIYNLAAILSAKGEKDPNKTWNLNTQSFLNVANVSIELGIKKIFWPSSIAVFGLNSGLEFVKNDVPMLPTTIYGISKLACEKLMYYYNTKNILDIRSLRYPGIVSASKPGGGTTDYIVEMLYSGLKKEKYICSLKQNRILPMIHINDSVDAAIQLMNIEKKYLSIKYPYNITSFNMSPHQWKQVINDLGYRFDVDYVPDFKDEIAKSWPKAIDDNQLRNDINWKPKYNRLVTAESILKSIQS